MTYDPQMVRKGSGVSLAALLDQARVSGKLYEEEAPVLGRFGFRAPQGRRLYALIDQLGSSQAAAADARTQAQQTTMTEREALAATKSFKRLVVSAAADLEQDGTITSADRKAFLAGEELGRSTPKHSKYLGDISATLERLNDAFEPLMGGINPIARLHEVKAALDGAQATQEFSLDALPADTAEVYAAKGELLGLIEKLNRTGQRAFDGDAVTRARFNKDLILRAVKARKDETLAPTG